LPGRCRNIAVETRPTALEIADDAQPLKERLISEDFGIAKAMP